MIPEVFAPRSAQPIFISVGPASRRFSVPYRVSPSVLARPSVKAWPLSWGSVPYGAFGRPEPTQPGLASPGTLRLQAFAASWRLASPDASRPCFMPVTPLGFALQSLSPSSSRAPLGTALPSCRSPSRFGSASGPCSGAWVRGPGGPSFRSHPRPDALLGFLPLQGSPLSRAGSPFGSPPPVGFSRASSPVFRPASPPGAPSGVSRAAEVALGSLETRRPSWGFSPRRRPSPVTRPSPFDS